MSHYETLEVAPDATAQEIKAAYRRKASEAHTDRAGGDDEAMKAINRAKEILCDPERRKQYDETARDDKPETPQSKALKLLMIFIEESLTRRGDLLAMVRKDMDGKEKEGRDLVNTLVKQREFLMNRRAKIRAPGGENLIHGLIDGQLADIASRITSIGVALDELLNARSLLDDYESDEVVPPAQDNGMYDLMGALGIQANARFGRPPF